MQAIHYFPGGNTAEGFCSHFGDILPAPVRRRMFYLKGGPGVGKSTLMRRVGEAAEKAGLEVEYFHCCPIRTAWTRCASRRRGRP